MTRAAAHAGAATAEPHHARHAWELRAHDLCVQRGARIVVEDVNLTIRAGDCFCIIGPNGAGKTSLMLAMLGQLTPARGALELDGQPTSRMPARRRGRWASYVPQMRDAISGFTVFDVVSGGRFPYVGPLAPLSAADLEHVCSAIQRCGLSDLADRPVSQLSAGERQKSLIAAAIAQDADIMFLDEPNTALDPAYQIELVSLLRHWRESGRGFVVITHDLQLPAALPCTVAALRGGRLVAAGTAAEILTPHRLHDVFGAEFEALSRANGTSAILPKL